MLFRSEDVRVPELLGVPVPEAVAVELKERVCEALPVSERVAELLGVPVVEDVGVELEVRVAELLGVPEMEAVGVELEERVCEALPVSERVEELLMDGPGVIVLVGEDVAGKGVLLSIMPGLVVHGEIGESIRVLYTTDPLGDRYCTVSPAASGADAPRK